jgi:predicted SAM-dependent methyltransferase
VQLGPGQGNYLEGWYNVDANFVTAKVDVWADLRHRLPFRDSTVDALYSHHVVEHLPDLHLPFHFGEIFRILKPGGVIRVGGPDADTAMRKYIEGDHTYFTDFPDKRDSVGGKLVNCLICRGEHLTLLTPSYLTELCEKAGFVNIRRSYAHQTHYLQWFGKEVLDKEWDETPERPYTLLVEAEKPKG